MFEYAFLFSLLKNESKLPEIKCYKHYDENEDKRLYALNPFNISIHFDVKDEKKSFNFFSLLLFKRKMLSVIFKNTESDSLTKKYIKHGIFYSNNHNKIDIKEMRTNKRIVLVEGYFQSYKYFDRYREEIQREFNIVKDLNLRSKKLSDEINSCNSVCVHIRRGDYLKSYYAPRFNLCDYEYYKKAMDYVFENTENPVFYVFSNSHDDVEWIKSNYDFKDYNVRYVDLKNSDYEDLQLMINCKHFIISNSTYSWWAQYLCTNPDKIIVAPSKWRRIDKDVSPLIMPEFKLIDVE